MLLVFFCHYLSIQQNIVDEMTTCLQNLQHYMFDTFFTDTFFQTRIDEGMVFIVARFFITRL
jgi:hypothetical protein